MQIAYTFANGETGETLQTGANARYVLPRAAAGTTVVCGVAVTNTGGTTVGKTNATSRIGAVPQVKIQSVSPLTATRGKTVTLRVVLKSPPGLSGIFQVCATSAAAVGGRLCATTHRSFGASGSFPFVLHLKIKPTALGTARVAISAVAGLSSAKTTAVLRIAQS